MPTVAPIAPGSTPRSDAPGLDPGRTGTNARRTTLATSAALLSWLLLASSAHALERCIGALHTDVCAEQTGWCPASAPAGLVNSDWPVFQHDVQHTGKSTQPGPMCASPQPLWTAKLKGRIQSAPVIGPSGPSGQGTIYVPASHNPICALDPTDGHALWCNTTDFGRDVGYSGPVLAQDDSLYVGTRDNDLWDIELPSPAQDPANVLWRQKVCTDGDVVTPPVIANDGVVYMGSDSLSSGSLFAMCPGPTRQVKWCHNPVGGAVTNVSPALSLDQSRVYVTFQGGSVVSYDTASGVEKWRVKLEERLNNGRWNFTPVVHAVTGRIYIGFVSGLFAIDTQVDPGTLQESPVVTLLFPTYDTDSHRIFSPPALDVANDAIYFGASRGGRSTLYAITLAGQLKWKRTSLEGAVKNNPPVVDSAGRVYFAMKRRLYALDPTTGADLWTFDTKNLFIASPVIAPGRIYIGTKGAVVYALGCAP